MVIQKVSVTQQLVEYMREMIQTKKWKVGERIPSENELSKELNVSRASIHSAIQQFVALNILKSVQGKGTFLQTDCTEYLGNRQINYSSIKDIRDFLNFRLIVEPDICYYAAGQMTDEIIETLQSYYEKMAASLGDNSAFSTYDLSFHQTIGNTLNNTFINQALNTVYSNKELLMMLNESYGYQGLRDHERLLKALRNHDGEGARKIMQKQLLDAIDRMPSPWEA